MVFYVVPETAWYFFYQIILIINVMKNICNDRVFQKSTEWYICIVYYY